ncbi:MAG: PQQ-binding-like beta-propeller repeat protein [Thermoplasmata archaeon]
MSSTEAQGLDDSSWPSFQNDKCNSGYSPISTEDYDGKSKWKFDTESVVIGAPSMGEEDTLYVGTFSGEFFAVSNSGLLKWKFKAEDQIRTSPAVADDGTIYFGSRDGYLYALDGGGSLKWKYMTDGYIDSSPVIDEDGNIYFGSYDGYLYCLRSSGSLRWKFNTNSEVITSPALDDGTVYVGCYDGVIYAIDDSGELEWKFTSERRIQSSPTVDIKGNIYFGNNEGVFYSLSPDGEMNWNYSTGGWLAASAAVDLNGNIFIGSTDGYLYSFNESGSLKWRYEVPSFIRASCIVTSDGRIHFGTVENVFYSLNMNGQARNKYYAGSSFYSAPLVGSDGTIYVVTKTGTMHALGKPAVSPETPSSPKNIGIKYKDNYVEISWEKPDEIGTSEITHYNIYRGNKTGEETYKYSVTADELSFRDTSVKEGETYSYLVTSVNSAGESGPSEPVEVTTTEHSDNVSGPFGIELNFFMIGFMIILIVISISTVLTVRRSKHYKEQMDGFGDKGDIDKHLIFTCPHCGYISKVSKDKEGPIRCARCKSWIQPPISLRKGKT